MKSNCCGTELLSSKQEERFITFLCCPSCKKTCEPLIQKKEEPIMKTAKELEYEDKYDEQQNNNRAYGNHYQGLINDHVKLTEIWLAEICSKLSVENNKMRENLRDEFAIAALSTVYKFVEPSEIADWCYRIADSFLKAREAK